MTTVTQTRAVAEPTKRKVFTNNDLMTFGAFVLFGILAPIVFPNYTYQIAVLWLMVLFAQTWDVMGGQMGYNSLGNIFFFGAGMYICTVTQVGLFTDVGVYTSSTGQQGRYPCRSRLAGCSVLAGSYTKRLSLALSRRTCLPHFSPPSVSQSSFSRH